MYSATKTILSIIFTVGLLGSASAQTEAQKAFYAPADKFPKNPIGIKLIGHFKVMGDPKIGYYLTADSDAGESDNMRRFNLPQGVKVNNGEKYNITKEAPLIVSSGGVLGGYDVQVTTAKSQVTQNPNNVKGVANNASVKENNTPTTAPFDPFDPQPQMKKIGEVRSHFNDNSLVFEIEKGGNPTFSLPDNLTKGEIEFVPSISKIVTTTEGVSPDNYMAQATFKDKTVPNVYYVYEIENIQKNLGKDLFLKGIHIYNFKDPKEYSQIDYLVKNKQGSPIGVWQNSKTLSDNAIRNSYVLLNSKDEVILQSDGDIDILSPMYRSYNKFIEWNNIATEKKPENFVKQFPNNQGVFMWMNQDNNVNKKQIGSLCPIPPFGYQSNRNPYSYPGWTEGEVNEIMRAFYFYPSARLQIANYIKDQISKVESSKKDIENSFK
jgi:hypothetical protein